jgi:hypothetical protein
MISSEIEAGHPSICNDQVIVKSDDGQVSYRLQSTRHGLWVQRERCRQDRHERLIQSVIFANTEQFSRWCEADSVRFDYPLVFAAIARAGHHLLDQHGR